VSETVLSGSAPDDVDPIPNHEQPSSRRSPRRPRRHRRIFIVLVALAVVGFIAVDTLSVLALRDAHDTRTEVRERRSATRRATRTALADDRGTREVIEARAGERDMSRWYTGVTQQQVESSITALGNAQSVTSALQARIGALNQCIDGVNQTLAKLFARDRAAAAGILGFVSPACNDGIGATGGRAPVLAFDFPDPFVMRAGDTYYAYSTNGGGGDIQIATSPDLRHWSLAGNALAGLPRWGAPNRTWAPTVLPRLGPFGAYYVLFYTVGGHNRPSCISRAVSMSPTGPFVDDSSGPLVCPAHGDAIDPSPFIDGDSVYLTWRGADAQIWSQTLAGDGLALTGEPRALIGPNQSWEHSVVEGPSMTTAGGRYYLFYSAAKWSTRDYAIGYALCDSPLGPCRKPQEVPVFASRDAIAGPGGQELFTDAGGRLWMAYHGYTEPNVGYPNSRRLHLLPVGFDAAGVPVLLPADS
jgi:Glycosyl hydrolases family 43